MYAWMRENAHRRAEAEGHRRAVHLQGAQEGDRSVQAADVEHRRRAPRSAIGQSLEERFTFLMQQLKIDGTAAAVAKFVTVPQVADRPRGGDRRRGRKDHRGREEGRRPGRLAGNPSRHPRPWFGGEHLQEDHARSATGRPHRSSSRCRRRARRRRSSDRQLVDRNRARRIALAARLECPRSCRCQMHAEQQSPRRGRRFCARVADAAPAGSGTRRPVANITCSARAAPVSGPGPTWMRGSGRCRWSGAGSGVGGSARRRRRRGCADAAASASP